MTHFSRPIVLLAAAAVLLGGCTKQARLNRHLSQGDEYAKEGDYDKAEEEYRAALRLTPNQASIAGRIGVLYHDSGRIQAAHLLLKPAVKAIPEDMNLRLHFALTSFSLGQTMEARGAAGKVLEAEPRNEEALRLLAITCTTTRDNDETRRMIEQLREKNGTGAGYSVALGLLAEAEGDHAAAEKEFRSAVQFDLKSSAAHAELGELLLLRKDTAQGAEELKTAAGLSPLRGPRRIEYVDFLLRTGAIADAKKELALINTGAADFVPAWTRTMKLAFQEHNYAECEAAVERVLGRDKINYDARLQHAVLTLSKGDTQGAITEFRDLAFLYDQSPQIRYQLALACLQKGDVTAAEESLAHALLLSPNYEEAILLIADLNLRKGNITPVISTLAPLIERRPRLSRAYVVLAQAYRAQGDLAKELEVVQAMTKAFPQSPDGYFLIGLTLIDLGQRDQARQTFEQALRVAPDYWPAQEVLVEDDLLGKRTAAATERVERLLQQYPKMPTPSILRAKVRLVSGDVAGAESDLLRAIEIDPKSHHAYLQLAKIYYHTNRTDDALEKLKTASTGTKSIPAQMLVGMMQAARKQYGAARDAYEKVLAVDPNFVPALNNLAALYSENLAQLERGLTLAKKARDIAPLDPVVADTLGWIYFRKGQLNTAMPLLQASAKLLPGEPEVLHHLGMAYYELGEEQPARRAFEAAIAAPIDSPAKALAQARLAILTLDPAQADPALRERLKQQVVKEPNDPLLRVRVAAIEEYAGESTRAAEHYEAALKLTPRSAATMWALAKLYYGPLANPGRAKTLAQSAHELAPGDSHLTWFFGRTLCRVGEFAWAVNILQYAARELPDQPELLIDLASACYSAGQTSDAAVAARRALQVNLPPAQRAAAERLIAMIDAAKSPAAAEAALPGAQKIIEGEPGYIPALFVSALAHEHQGDYPTAGLVYEDILSRNPSFGPAIRQLALLYALQLGNGAKAETLATKARTLFPNDPELAFALGVLRYRKAEYTAALRFLRESSEGHDEHALTHYYVGMSQFYLKKVPESIAALRRALELKLPPRETEKATQVLAELNTPGGN